MMKFPTQQSFFLQQNVTFEQWQNQLLHYKNLFEESSQNSFLLFEQDSYLFSVLFFALIAANKRIILPPSGQIQQIKQCLSEADIFVGSNSYPELAHFDLTNDKMSQSDPVLKKNTELNFNPDNEIVFFTSGSSGQPKKISKTFAQLICEVEVLEKTFANNLDQEGKSSRSIVMATVSHQHIYGLLFKLIWPIWSGRDLYLKVFEYPEHLVHQINQYPTRKICLISSPAYYHRLLKDNVLVEIKSQLNVLFSSGGPLNADAAIQLQSELGLTPIEIFGSTETGGIGWRQKQHLTDEVWKTFEAIECQCCMDSQQLIILSPYINKFKWYQTDDRVELIDKHRFKLLGRTDRIVKIEEKRCSLDEVQACLDKHEWVEQAYVMTLGGLNGERHYLATVIELNQMGQIELKNTPKFKFDRQLKTYLKDYFEALIIPRKFRYIETMPHNSQGKLNKQELEAYFD